MFKSESSKNQALASVDKLILNFLPGSESVLVKSTKPKKLSSGALIVDNMISKKNDIQLIAELQRKTLKKQRLLKKSQILAKITKSKEINKLAKINKLKAEQKYNDSELQDIIKTKTSKLRSWENVHDEEFKLLEKQVLQLADKDLSRRKKVKLKNQKKMDFNRKLQRGIIAYPGLTPGLAPVDLTDDDDESD